MEQGVNATAQSNRRMLTAGQYQKTSYNSLQYSRPKTPSDVSQPRKDSDKFPVKTKTKFREPGACKYCGQKWFFGHRCQQYKSLNLMTAEGDEQQDDP
jgi:hypothetical protein